MSVTLTGAMRTNLLSLQGTESLISAAQNRLATGKKVNSALDDPRNFFTSSALNSRASDLSRRLDGIGLAVKTIEAADKGLKAMTKVVESMAAIAKQARDSTVAADRTALQTQFVELQDQLADLADDSGFNGTNLLSGDTLTIDFNEDASNQLAVTGAAYGTGDADEAVDIVEPTLWGTVDAAGDTAIDASITLVNSALTTMRTQAATFGANLSVVKAREEFTKDMVSTLKSGADNLVLADINEESANLLTLQTRQQLGVQALSLANQSQQSVLRLF